jgi:hypothetical protein
VIKRVHPRRGGEAELITDTTWNGSDTKLVLPNFMKLRHVFITHDYILWYYGECSYP